VKSALSRSIARLVVDTSFYSFRDSTLRSILENEQTIMRLANLCG